MSLIGPARKTPLAAESVHRVRFARPGVRAWVRVGAAATHATVRLNGRFVGTHLGAWTPFEFEVTDFLRDDNELEVRCADRLHTTNGFLPSLGVRWTGARDIEIRTEPTPVRPPAPQRSSTRGTQLLVDTRPFRVRGILHWGYYGNGGAAGFRERPSGCDAQTGGVAVSDAQEPDTFPFPTEAQMRREIADMKALGFNLIKFCLWIPPERYYQLCQDMGILVWQEYPVWDAPLNDRAIVTEFEEFFRHDAPYSCVILRTLTCENDHVAPEIARELVELCHAMIPGSLVLDNSGWLCAERYGDFHDEHVYLNNIQMPYYARRVRGRLTKPLLIGEGLHAYTPAEGPHDVGLASRRQQIRTLARDLPDAGYVLTVMRDPPPSPTGLYDAAGRLKYTAEQWAWHRDDPGAPRDIPEPAGPIIGPRKGEWKCPEYTWWSPVVRVLDPSLPAKLIEDECVFDLLSGRVLENCEGTRILVEVLDVAAKPVRRLPLVIEFTSDGDRRVVSAFRHDTPAGRELWRILQARCGPAPEIGPLIGTSIVLEDWEMSFDGRRWQPVKCDTPLVNRGRNVFEGWATFRTRVDYPGGRRILRCEAVGDYYEVLVDGRSLGEAGPRHGTWDGTRDIPRNFDVDLPAGYHDFVFRVRDWRGGGGMVGPVYMATNLHERIF